ncbi:MAG TPA: hypothetical protein DCL43_03415 [Chitinophagaceae bacterium]|nr:hypothetical protein [Chitinophagaceae bacterium]HAN39374.1 hypothetical protein [Chitinophagaceae bacterium]
MKKQFIYILVFLYLTVNVVSQRAIAQDITFSQFYEMPMLRNPALAGVFNADIRMSGMYRSQWGQVSVPFQTGGAGLEYKIPFNQYGDWITLGLQTTHDVAGDVRLKRTQVLPVLNFHKSLNANYDDYLSIAFMAGPVNSQFDPTKLQMDEQYFGGQFNPTAPVQTFERTGFSYWDASLGLSYTSSWGEDLQYYVGAGYFHFNKPKVAFYTSNSDVFLNPKLVFNAGVSMQTSEVNNLVMFADYFTQGGHRQFLGGFLYGTEIARNYNEDWGTTLYFGAMYRWNDALIPVMKMDIKRLMIGVSYDVNVSTLRSASQWQGGLELTIGYKASLRHRSAYANQVRCVNGLKF